MRGRKAPCARRRVARARCASLRSSRQAFEAERARIDDRIVARNHIGNQAAGAGTYAEAVAGKSARQVKTGQPFNRRDHRHGVGRHVNQPGPALGDRRVFEGRKIADEIGSALGQDRLRRLRIKNSDSLERRWRIQRPAARNIPFFDEAGTAPAPLRPLHTLPYKGTGRTRGKSMGPALCAGAGDRSDCSVDCPPFTEAGKREFSTFLWMPPSGARAGDIVLVDLTMFTTLFGGGES